MMHPIRVGIIGCGEITQLMHLPFLDESPDFEVSALCELSHGTMTALAERYRVPHTHARMEDLVADDTVDVVFVCSFDHAPAALAAVRAGKHVLVEKPLAFTPDEAREIAAEADRAGVVAMVGYMKLFDPAFAQARELIAQAGPPRARQVHDFAGRFDAYRALYDQVRVDDIPAGELERTREDVQRRIEAHLGTHAGHSELYTLLLMLGAHDLAVLRVAFGSPERVGYAASTGPNHLIAVLEYSSGPPVTFEIAVGTRYDWWDEWLSVDTDSMQLRLEFSHPYVRYACSYVHLRESRGEHEARSVLAPPADDPFRRELRHLAAAIRAGEELISPLAGGVADLELATALIRALPPTGV